METLLSRLALVTIKSEMNANTSEKFRPCVFLQYLKHNLKLSSKHPFVWNIMPYNSRIKRQHKICSSNAVHSALQNTETTEWSGVLMIIIIMINNTLRNTDNTKTTNYHTYLRKQTFNIVIVIYFCYILRKTVMRISFSPTTSASINNTMYTHEKWKLSGTLF